MCRSREQGEHQMPHQRNEIRHTTDHFALNASNDVSSQTPNAKASCASGIAVPGAASVHSCSLRLACFRTVCLSRRPAECRHHHKQQFIWFQWVRWRAVISPALLSAALMGTETGWSLSTRPQSLQSTMPTCKRAVLYRWRGNFLF